MALWQDVRFAVRQLRKSPGFTLTVVAILALCIGVNTAVFSVLDAVLLRAAPYPHADRLAQVVTAVPGAAKSFDTLQTGALFEAVRDKASGLDVAAYAGTSGANFAFGDRPEYIVQQRVSAGYFRVLGVAPAMGREFTREEDVPNGAAVAILSYGFWQRALHGDPAVLGRTISLRGEPYTLAGIMPREFRAAAPVDVWTPLGPSRDGEGAGFNYGVVARLRPGVSWEQASQQLRSLSQALHTGGGFPPEMKNFEQRIVPLQAGATADVRTELLLTWAAVLMVLLIGCVNIAGLLVARSGMRAREVATRMALGGSRGAIVRQLLVESMMLAMVGGMVGISVGGFTLDWLKQLGAEKNQLWYPIELDARVLAAMLGVALVTSLLFGLAPALDTSRLDIRAVLNEAGRGIAGTRRHFTRGVLVVAEVALSLVLLIGAGLMVRSLVWLNGLNPGFDTRNVLVAETSLQDARYQTAASVNRLYAQTLERMRRVPGVRSAAVALTLPYERPLNNAFRAVDGIDGEERLGEVVYTTPGYFETMGIPIVAGRGLRDTDTIGSAKIVVVSQSLAARYFAHGDAVGHHVDLGGGSREIVGIAGDVQQHSGIKPSLGPLSVEPTVYISVGQARDGFLQMAHTWFSPKWVIRTSGAPTRLSGQIRAAVAEVDPRLPIAHFRTVEDLRNAQTGSQRYLAALFSLLATIALVLAAIGLYGLISQSIARRRHEIGIRLALGASAPQTIANAMRPGIVLSLAGIAAGLGLSLGAVRFLRSLLWGVRETDPATFIGTAAILLLVAALASMAPALRILRMDPAETLRSE